MNKVCFRSPLLDSRLSRKLLSESAYPDSVSSKKTVYQRCSSSVSSCCSSLRCLVPLICLSWKICSTLVPSSWIFFLHWSIWVSMGIPSLGLAQIVAQMTAASSIWTDKKRPKSRAFVYTHTTGYGLGGFNSPHLHHTQFSAVSCNTHRALSHNGFKAFFTLNMLAYAWIFIIYGVTLGVSFQEFHQNVFQMYRLSIRSFVPMLLERLC